MSVVIPARNEASNIARCLESVVAQTSPPEEIIVVDDDSDDATVDIVRRFETVELVRSDALPEGWTGKSWAAWQGAQAAHGSVLVFLDADVVLGPRALGSIAARLDASGGLLSVLPTHETERMTEWVSLPFGVVQAMGAGIGAVLRPESEWAAAGPCIACSRRDYMAVGGHDSVRNEIAEDLALARCFRAAGLGVNMLGGGDLVGYRMYEGVGAALEGWAKNIAVGASKTPLLRALAIGVWVTATLRAAWLVTSSTSDSKRALVYGAFVFQFWRLGSQVGHFGAGAVFWPLHALVFVIVTGWSAFSNFVLGRTRWRGRAIPTRRGAS